MNWFCNRISGNFNWTLKHRKQTFSHKILDRIPSDINQINTILFLGSGIKVSNFVFNPKGLGLFSFIPQLNKGFPNFELPAFI